MKTFTLFLLLVSSIAFGQTERLNQLDSAGRKDGKWIMYYNNYCSVIKDSPKASYYCYVYYVHGRKYVTEATWGDKKWKLVDSANNLQRSGKIKLLDGKYTWYNEKGQLMTIRYYDKGELVYNKLFYPSGKLCEWLDYTKQFKGQPHSGYLYEYVKNGTPKDTVPLHIYKDKKGSYWGGAN
ncbi:MAG TPA: hypothetical protein VK890_03740 [Bacteroidia bacterium]|jgi:hypothetical protein|nr:hypothetical protein [Bacteroidia bacterium]